MDKWKIIKRCNNILLYGLLGFLSAAQLVRCSATRQVPHYVEKNLESIMKAQEERLGIQHVGVPKIEYPSFLAPLEFSFVDGAYNEENDTIYLPLHSPSKILAGSVPLTPKQNITNTLGRNIFEPVGFAYDIKKVLDHELGHFYTFRNTTGV